MERHRPLVLVADDDEDILELVRFRLARSGYDTICAHDGTQALSLAAGQGLTTIGRRERLPYNFFSSSLSQPQILRAFHH